MTDPLTIAIRTFLEEHSGASARRFRESKGDARLKLWRVHQRMFWRALRTLKERVHADAVAWREEQKKS